MTFAWRDRLTGLLEQHFFGSHFLDKAVGLPRQDARGAAIVLILEIVNFEVVISGFQFQAAGIHLHLVRAAVVHHLLAINEQARAGKVLAIFAPVDLPLRLRTIGPSFGESQNQCWMA